MQLKNKSGGDPSLAASIATATCGLLGAAQPSTVIAQEVGKLETDSAILYYAEGDNRVQDASAHIDVSYAFNEDRKLSVKIAVDTLTGATPNGAAPSSSVQTFTTPSGNAGYQIAAGAAPLDPTFQDTRTALGVSWQQSIGEASRLNFGVTGSSEYDYFHLGANARFEHDFNLKNTTLFAGVAYASDEIDPVGGAPVPFAVVQQPSAPTGKLGSDTKTVLDGILGVTQILSRRALIEVNYSYSQADGYLNDPYKILSVVDGVTGLPVAGPGSLNRYLYESRPDSRTKQSLYTEYRYALDRDSFALSYRFMTDDWDVTSHTLEARYRWNVFSGGYLEPHLRYYTQSAANFYRTVLRNNDPLPTYASADYRLADMDAVTAGIKFGTKLGRGDFTTRLEYYQQTAVESPGSKFGALASYDLVQPLTAFFIQVGYKFGF